MDSGAIKSCGLDTTWLICEMRSNSSSGVWIEDCYISTGDDVSAMKSGWDE